jgi:regulatory protein
MKPTKNKQTYRIDVMTSERQPRSEKRLSEERIKKRLTNKALHYLGRYASSSDHLETILLKFAKRKLDQADSALVDQMIREVIKSCVKLGYIDDEAFVRSQFRQGLRNGLSQRRILLKLAQKGISQDLAMIVMNEQADDCINTENSELAAALIYARKKSIGPYSCADLSPEDSQKNLARLARIGFPFYVAKQVMALPSVEAADVLLEQIYPHQLS